MTESGSLAQTIVVSSTGLVSAGIAAYCTFKVAQLKTHVNSRMDELLRITSESAHAKGMLEGATEQKEANRIEILTQKAEAKTP